MRPNAFHGFLFYIIFYTHFLNLEKYLETSQMQVCINFGFTWSYAIHARFFLYLLIPLEVELVA